MNEPFDAVFICTGNRFRSPLAAATFAAAARGRPVCVRSCGTLQLHGAPALAEAVALSLPHGIDLSAHRSCCLDDLDLREADLVAGFEPKHVARAVVDAGAPVAKTFLLGDLVEALEAGAPPEDGEDPLLRARRAVSSAHERRPRPGAGPPPIPDPYGGRPGEYEDAAARVRGLALRLADALFPGDSRTVA